MLFIKDWFHEHQKDRRPDFHPFVPDALPSLWYKKFESRGTQDSMWTMWFIYYTYMERLYTVYSNLATYTRDVNTCLSINRREIGLHYFKKGSEELCALLSRWNDDFVKFPANITKLHFDGSVVRDGLY